MVFRNGVAYHPLTWRRITFGLILIAAKYWDELSIWNNDFKNHVPKANIDELQDLEMALLKLLNFEMKIPGDIFTRYYFALRSLSRSKKVLPRTEMRLLDSKGFYELERAIVGIPRKKVLQTLSPIPCTFVENCFLALN